ncbi:hypothetical protein KJ781_02575 [Patescibacteria group bacterium]|nr:hypothetical protein [Patescibacteria group bacterium]MBU1448260.1 hypothetical protein [Patescibacteria group bacterium]MBU2613067.1 hypothetical protein [Patescibacteria group bacterium]
MPEQEFEDANGGDTTRINAVDTKLILAKRVIGSIRDELMNLEILLASDAESVDLESLIKRQNADGSERVSPMQDGRVIEGVFDGQHMVGSDGRQYLVPQNYASKSKLVEGDILKLSIHPNGSFLFKQIGPIERERVVGVLVRDENTHEWKVVAGGKKYGVLPASVSYFKGMPNDNVVVLIPKSAPSRWAAVENVVHRD